MTDKPKYPAAYLPLSTFLTALDHLKAVSIPNQIEGRTFPSLAGQAQSQILSAFRFFELVDSNGVPQPELKVLVNKDDERKATMKRLIEKYYPDIVALDFATMTPTQLDEKLSGERYNIAGETKKKAKTFLLKAAQFAGFKVHPLLIKITRNRKGSGKKGNSTAFKTTPIDYSNLQNEKPKQPNTGTETTIQLKSGGTLTLTLDINVLKLVGKDREFVFHIIDQIQEYESYSETAPAKA